MNTTTLFDAWLHGTNITAGQFINLLNCTTPYVMYTYKLPNGEQHVTLQGCTNVLAYHILLTCAHIPGNLCIITNDYKMVLLTPCLRCNFRPSPQTKMIYRQHVQATHFDTQTISKLHHVTIDSFRTIPIWYSITNSLHELFPHFPAITSNPLFTR